MAEIWQIYRKCVKSLLMLSLRGTAISGDTAEHHWTHFVLSLAKLELRRFSTASWVTTVFFVYRSGVFVHLPFVSSVLPNYIAILYCTPLYVPTLIIGQSSRLRHPLSSSHTRLDQFDLRSPPFLPTSTDNFINGTGLVSAPSRDQNSHHGYFQDLTACCANTMGFLLHCYLAKPGLFDIIKPAVAQRNIIKFKAFKLSLHSLSLWRSACCLLYCICLSAGLVLFLGNGMHSYFLLLEVFKVVRRTKLPTETASTWAYV